MLIMNTDISYQMTEEDAAFFLKRLQAYAEGWWRRFRHQGNMDDFVDSGIDALIATLQATPHGKPFQNTAHFRAYLTRMIQRELPRTFRHYDCWLHCRKKGVHRQRRDERGIARSYRTKNPPELLLLASEEERKIS